MDTDFAQLWTNQAVAEDTRNQLESELREVLHITQSRVMFQRSYGIPELIQIVLDAVEWVTPLKAAAAFFVYHLSRFLSSFEKKLGEKAAEEAWDNREKIKEVLYDTTTRPLRKVAAAIAKARRSSANQTYVRIGLPIPSDYFAATLDVEGEDEATIALVIALFVLKAEDIEKAIREESKGKEILGGVNLELRREGSFSASWKDRDSNHYEVIIE